MILQSLYELYERLSRDPDYDISPPGYSQQKISFRLVIKSDGTLHNIEFLDSAKKRALPMVMPGGAKSTGKITEQSVQKKVRFLRNDLPFMVGLKVDRDNAVLSIAKREFEAFKKYHLEKETQINDSDYAVFCNFLRNWKPEEALNNKAWIDLNDGQGAIQLQGKEEYLHERPLVRAWWDAQQRSAEGNGDGKALNV